MRNLKLNFILFIVFICFSGNASAQWIDRANPSSLDIQSSFFTNENTGWICGRYNDLFTSGPLLKTIDGGANWTAYNYNFSGALFDMQFIDANTGFATGRYTFKTTNGGVNWTQLTLAVNAFHVTMSFVNSSTGYLGGFFGTFQKTTNGGTSWTEIGAGVTSQMIYGSYFINASTGWFTGDAGGIFKTTNGGASFQTYSVGASTYLEQIYFSDANNGVVAGNGASYRTTNGGQNWTAMPDLAGKDLNSLSFISSQAGWAAGYDGLYFTTDGGLTWDMLRNGNSQDYVSVNGFSSATVYAVGNIISKSTSGGYNINAPTNLSASAVSSSLINLSWIDNSGEDKFIIERSTNGSSWSTIDSVGADINTYQSSGLSANTDYYYRVAAKKSIFRGSVSNTASTRTYLPTPVNSSPANSGKVNTITPTLTWSAVTGGLYYNCEVATDTNFTNIVYARGATVPGTSQVIPNNILQSSSKYYWRVISFNFSNASMPSAIWSFTVQDSNYGHNMLTGNNKYFFANSTAGANLAPSKPTYNWRDTSGSIYLVKNGAFLGSLYAGNSDDGIFRLNSFLTGSDAIKFFGNNYQTLFIGTNGVVSFSVYDPQLGINIEPPTGGLAATNITNAILPLWKDFNFTDADVAGRTLCYKVTSSEIIISYLKAPSYNSAVDANDYVSFQVIIQHSVNPGENSKIDFMYNYNETGSSFITKYNNNTSNAYLTGIRGTAGQEFQYRFFNSSLQLIDGGPLFGSNLALEFGPNASLLPVELSSFTSEVKGSSARLAWSTVSELNNSGFEIQRTSANENEWKKINFVRGNGTSNESHSYSYEDKNLASGKYQYRLKQIDFNGNYEYFNLLNEVAIGTPGKFNLSQNYPNPFNPVTKISFDLPQNAKVKLSVYDITGKLAGELVNEQRAPGYYTVEFNGASLSSGTYFYVLEAGDFKSVKKMVLIK